VGETVPIRPRPSRLSLAENARVELLQLIQRGGFAGGAQLPPERQLAERLKISRPTLREALRILEQEGSVVRRVGVGTFVNEVTQIEAGLESLDSFTESIARTGHKAGTSKLTVREGEFNTSEADKFKVEPGTPKIVVERVRTIDGRPAMYSVHVSPKTLLGELDPEEYRESFFALLELKTRTSLSHSFTHIYSTLAAADIARKLRLSGNIPLLVLDELVYDVSGRMVCTSLSYFRADVHSYHIVRRRSERGLG